MIIEQYILQFESYIYIYMKITKLSNVNPSLFFGHFIVTGTA